ncbi:hypothetical protein QZH41_017578, partial [Actinostola sp. cb2023]
MILIPVPITLFHSMSLLFLFKDEEDAYEFDDSHQMNMKGAFMDEFFQKVADIRQKFERITEDVESVKKSHRAILTTAASVNPDQDEEDAYEFDDSHQMNMKGAFMEEFFQKVADIRQKIERITEDVESVKESHRAILTTAVPDQGLKDNMEACVSQIQRTANGVRSNLKAMERDEKQVGTSYNLADARIKRCQHAALSRKFVEVMIEYNTTQTDYREKCKARIQRQLEIVGKAKTSEEVEDMLESGNPAFFSSDIVIETQQATQALDGIKARHTCSDIITLEKGIQELEEMSQDMYICMLVESQ